MKKRSLIIFSGILIFLLALILLLKKSETVETDISVRVQRGNFDVLVYTTGQLEAERSENIYLPKEMTERNVNIYELNLTAIVEEGTVVDSGDYVATLDHKTVEEMLKKVTDEMDQSWAEYEDSKMDSSLTLSNQRDQITNAEMDLEEKQIIKKESVYESPSVQKKADLDLDKARRKLVQEKKSYQLKKSQEQNKVSRRFLGYTQRKQRVDDLQDLYDALVVVAPSPGIVIYDKNYVGEKIKEGSTISRWRPVIATLPDMSSLISLTYVNEIDISKVKTGQQVILGVDAFPGKELKGEVISMASIGQSVPNSDAKVFEVKIRIFGEDNSLKPAMTTSNVIQAGSYPDTLFVPSDAVFKNDSLQYVFLKQEKMVKQIVDLGLNNENFVLVAKGLSEGDELYLNPPANEDELPFAGLEIYAEQQKREAERKEKEAQEREAAKKRDEQQKEQQGQRKMPGTLTPPIPR